MDELAEFYERLAALGDFATLERSERTLVLTLGGTRALITERQAETIRGLLPVWLQPVWHEATPLVPQAGGAADLVGRVAAAGGYAYRAAAERHVRAVLAGLREYLDERAQAALADALSGADRDLFLQAGACVYDASAGKFL